MSIENFLHVIKDPVHGTMQFTSVENNWIKPFIDSENFQRLRHIKQLGMADYIFPGAVHTRFNHSLGCCYIASQIAHKIGLNDNDRQLVMIACLLHDIGHGPFSHTFEDLFHDKVLRHEAWTSLFLADYRNEHFFENYNQLNSKHPLSKEKFALIEEMIKHTGPVKLLLADIVSSQLDADRLDYLLRDSHFCGVTYGKFDFHWMLNSMTMINTPKGERLGLTYKGIGVVEHYLMARRLMMRNIYFHQKKLAFEFYLVSLLGSLSKILHKDKLFSSIKKTSLGRFLVQVNQLNETLLAKSSGAKARTYFLEENYWLYKKLCDYDVFGLIATLTKFDSKHPIVQIATRLYHREMPHILRFPYERLSRVKEMLMQFKKTVKHYFDWQIAIIEIPHQSYAVSEDPILIIDETGAVQTIDKISLLIQGITGKLEHNAFLCIDKLLLSDKKVEQFLKSLHLKLEPE